jgi:predicted urease superfamily metal-dependent hydrolase
VRRLLARRRLYGVKVGFVWAVFPEDVEAFKRMRRPPGRPRKQVTAEVDTASDLVGERAHAGTQQRLRQRRRPRG